MSLNQQRNTPQTGLIRKTISWSFFILLILYIVYSSHFILTSDHQCLNSEVKLEEEQLVEHIQERPIANLSSSIMPRKHEEEIGENKEKDDNEIDQQQQQQPLMALSIRSERYDTNLKHIVFGIAANEKNWERKKEYVKVWFRPKETRGIVWVDKMVKTRKGEGLPEIRVSSDTSKLKYKNSQGQRSALRISRVVSEMLRLRPKDVRWFVMGDDDSVFIVDNVVRILSKYDHRQFYYIGSSSESHLQNIFFSYNMAYGGGGFAISYPLAVELEKMQDNCIQRYPGLYGSDDRIQACMAELGVPLTKEAGFHQYDVYGNLLGLLAAHPVTPLASLHHLDVVEPIFPGMTRVNSLHHLFKAVELDSASIMQQSICYDNKMSWSISVSWGFVVQITRGHISPRELEKPARTFLNWYRRADYMAYAFNTRPAIKHPCTKAFSFYMSSIKYDRVRRETIGVYTLQNTTHQPYCRWKMPSPERINSIVVLKKPDYYRWQKSPRRDCCRVLPPSKSATTLQIRLGNCQEGEYSVLQPQQT